MTALCQPDDNRRLVVRLATDADDIAAVQRLRARVFFMEEGLGQGSGGNTRAQLLDSDVYDPLCDHLLVVDETSAGDERVVGTYRLLRGSVAQRSFGFYTAGEFDLGKLVAGPDRPAGELLELGRSCVLPAYRTSAVISLLWRGIAEYIGHHGIGLMFGCASFPGTDVNSHAAALSYIHHNCLADEHLRPQVLKGSGIALERLGRGTYDERRALCSMPPLVKGYLRVGARFGDGAFIDHAFNTIDVCVVLPVGLITDRYAARFSVAA